MKKIFLTILNALLLTVAFADDSDTQISSTNTIGITCVSSELVNFPLGITYGGYSNENVTVSITNILSTATLESGDAIWVFYEDQTGSTKGFYDMYVLSPDKVWEGQSAMHRDGDEPHAQTDALMAFGKGAWLVRNFKNSERDKRIITFGQVALGDVQTVVKEKTTTQISFPFSEALDLTNFNLVDWPNVAVKGDQIVFYAENGQTTTFSWTGSKWRSPSGGKSIPRGMSFFYNRKGAATTITWHLGIL